MAARSSNTGPNRGIGCVGVPLRVMCPPEVTEVTLLSPQVVGSVPAGWGAPPLVGG